ncbi:hypothetical protein PIB30_020394 [Stylosanthes scabra]|uniref:Uncharacterized protein n=1 Tax=Stylosanthes scabra TaxID=79078 RepID=A0ABU6R8R6_9FABA|nr:hypothetical protein [Stylosanthes scabra]
MATRTDLEEMGRELQCPICLSLLNFPVSLPCSHVFCNFCIVKSMKSSSDCPVCKLPFFPREVHPSPRTLNLVNIYKRMERSSGINLFLTQNPHRSNCSDEETQYQVDATLSHQNHAQKRKTLKRKGSMKKNVPDTAKPSLPAKKRVQVPEDPLSETPFKNSSFRDSLCGTSKEGKEKDTVAANEGPLQSERDVPVLSPFFWLREDEGAENLSQQSMGDQLINEGPTPNPPSFSDLMDSDDENPTKPASSDEVQNKSSFDFFDSEMFEWTQRPCSPELFSSPVKMQPLNIGEINENQEDLLEASQDLERIKSNDDAENKELQNPQEGTRLPDVLQPSATSLFRSSGDINGTKKYKRGKKTEKKSMQEQIAVQDLIEGINVDSNRSLEIHEDQSPDKQQASNQGMTNRNCRRVCFDTCTVSNISVVLGNDEVNNAKDSYISRSQKETEKLACQKIPGKCQTERSRKKKPNYEQHQAEELSCMQNQVDDELAGSTSSMLSQQTEKNGKISNKRQIKGKVSRKSISRVSELRSTKKLKLSTDFISQTKAGEEIQPNQSTQRSPDVNVLDDTSKEKHSTLMHAPVLQNCESHAEKYQCVFCHSSEESEASGPMMHYCGSKPVSADYEGGYKVIHSHRNCTEWAPNVYFEDDNAINLEAEISRSRKIKCGFCGLKGAALGCYEKSCRKSFHVPCAKWTSHCRWDMENFVMLCPLHTSCILPCERSGVKGKSNKCRARDSKSLACKHSTTNQKRTALGSYKKIVLCCSALSMQERDIVSEFERATKVTILKKWDSSVTHVIASTDENKACRRTLKVLMGILEGKWILNIEWIKACMKEMEPVDEEGYEINLDIHGINDGPRLGRLRVLNKQPKLFDGYNFYFMGDFIPSYKGYLQDLVTAAGGVILNRKPVSGDQNPMSPGMHPPQTLVIYSLELPDKCSPSERDTISTKRRLDAEVLASYTGSKIASNTWILNSIAACKLQSLAE